MVGLKFEMLHCIAWQTMIAHGPSGISLLLITAHGQSCTLAVPTAHWNCMLAYLSGSIVFRVQVQAGVSCFVHA